MRNRLFRTIAWLCLIAQLNLITPQFHEAWAMEGEEDYVTHVPPKNPVIDDQDFTPQPSHNILKEVNQALAPLLKCMPYLLIPLIIQAIAINGGADLAIPYKGPCLQYLPFDNKTAPYLRDVAPQDMIQTIFEFGLYDPNTSYPVGSILSGVYYHEIEFMFDRYERRYPGAINASIREFKRSNKTGYITQAFFNTTVEILQKLLSFPELQGYECEPYRANFNYYSMDGEFLINATRKYYHVTTPPIPDPDPYLGLYIFAGIFGIAIIGVFIYFLWDVVYPKCSIKRGGTESAPAQSTTNEEEEPLNTIVTKYTVQSPE